jgi:hypothetical protein
MPAVTHSLASLAEEVWAWRIRTQPDSYDDVPRVERPAGWAADWSPDAIDARRRLLAEFNARHRSLDLTAEAVAVQVDGRLLGSALARVHWELDLLRSWQRNPCFYLDQSLVPIFNLLLPPPPFDQERAAAIIRHLTNVPVILAHGRTNLAEHVGHAFGQYALRLLATGIDDVEQAMDALVPMLPASQVGEFLAAIRAAVDGLRRFRSWLGDQTFDADTAIGSAAFAFYLHRVALLPYSAKRIRAIGRHEFNRAVATETILSGDQPDVPPPPLTELIARQRADELEVRRF